MGRTTWLMGLSAVSLVMGSASGGSEGYYSCCKPPPVLVAMPPKPPWLQTSLTCKATGIGTEVNGQEEQNKGNTSTAASVSGTHSNTVSATTIAAIVIALWLLLAIVILLAIFVWYKKHRGKYPVSPLGMSGGMRCQRLKGTTRERPLSQQALVSSHSIDNTSQVSVSSEGETMPLEVTRKAESLPQDGSLQQPDPDAVHALIMADAPRFGHLPAARQPDIVESTLKPGRDGMRLGPLPVLRPIHSSYNPTFTRQPPEDGFTHQHAIDDFPAPITASRSPRLPPIRRSHKKKK